MVPVTQAQPLLSEPAPALSPGKAWALIGLMWIAYFLNYTDRQVVFSIFPVLKSDLKFSDTQLGLTGLLFLWVYALCNPLAGMLGDRFPRRVLIVISLLAWSAITALTGASTSAIMLLACRGVMGLAEALFFPAAVTLTAHAHGAASHSRAVALFSTAQIAGVAMGGWFGGVMAERHYWREAFYLLGLAGILYALPYHLVLRRIGEPPASPSPARASSVAGLFRIRLYALLGVVFPSFTFVIWMLYTWLSNFFYEKFSLTMGEAGFASSAPLQGGMLAGLLLGGLLADRLSRRVRAARFWLVAAGLILCAPSVQLIGNSPSLAVAKIAAAAFGVGGGLAMANFFPCCFDVVPRASHASAVGILNLLSGLVSGGASLLGGMLKQSVGLSALMTAAALLCGVMGALMALGARVWCPSNAARVQEEALS
jgi:MFS family permease